ncbi:MAG: alpha/beta hydrolase [Alphaproteobacteria bacterium HGW-Alphaproteobacteria-3]|nr:MAG: alpha/beta hydrolase [Alphaproteobacteria bacterium HGW-Alphaproteobacteria-3]
MSFQLSLLNLLMRWQVKRRFRKNPDVQLLRPVMLQMEPRMSKLPAGIALEELTLGGVATERLSAPGTKDSAAFLYIHGGGFVAGSPRTHRPLTWRLTRDIGIPVYAIDYRLAPEHPYPAGLDDCVAAYKGLLDKGIPAQSILAGGDSAGGNLTLALALRLKAESLPLPAALVCLSPATDMTASGDSYRTNAEADSLFVPDIFHSLKPVYFPGIDERDPFVSPLYGDVSGFPPTLFQLGEKEMLRDDSTRMAAALTAAGVETAIEVWPKVWHVWQLNADMLPEGREAIAHIVRFAKQHLA